MQYVEHEDSDCTPDAVPLDAYYRQLQPLLPVIRIHAYNRGKRNFKGGQVIPRGWLQTTDYLKEYYRHVFELINLQRYICRHNAQYPV